MPGLRPIQLETNPTWSPDGKRMVFDSVQNGEITNLHYGRATPPHDNPSWPASAEGNADPEGECSSDSFVPWNERLLKSPLASASRWEHAFVKRSFGVVLAAESVSSASQARLQPRWSAATLTVTMSCADGCIDCLVSNECHQV